MLYLTVYSQTFASKAIFAVSARERAQARTNAFLEVPPSTKSSSTSVYLSCRGYAGSVSCSSAISPEQLSQG